MRKFSIELQKCIYGYIVKHNVRNWVGNEKQFLYILHWYCGEIITRTPYILSSSFPMRRVKPLSEIKKKIFLETRKIQVGRTLVGVEGWG